MDGLNELEKIAEEVKRICQLAEKDRQREVDRKKAEEERKIWEEKNLRKAKRK